MLNRGARTGWRILGTAYSGQQQLYTGSFTLIPGLHTDMRAFKVGPQRGQTYGNARHRCAGALRQAKQCWRPFRKADKHLVSIFPVYAY